MLDQTFSAQNFRRIYERENRRGRNVDRRFFPELVIASAAISAASAKVRECRRNTSLLSKADLDASLKPLYEGLDAAREYRDTCIDVAIDKVADDAMAKSFQLTLAPTNGPNNTLLYPLAENSSSYFVGKQLQHNLSRLYKVKQSNRRSIVRQVKDLLSTSFNQYIIRTDISAFYESIDRAILLGEIDKDQLLSLSSKSHIKCVLMNYGTSSGDKKGIPRGVGISAYLAELFMRSVDERIKQIDGITFYARYVDDIIAIFSPTAMDNRALYLAKLEEIVKQRGLTLNPKKTKSGPAQTGQPFAFEYLGYDFSTGSDNCELELSAKKVARYKKRIDASFSAYQRESAKDQKGASRRLVARIKFITGNTRLANSKGFAFTGIYYNNSELTKLGKLSGLDSYLAHKNSTVGSATLQNRICQFSFKRGFTERPFYQYSTKAMAEIVKVWSYET